MLLENTLRDNLSHDEERRNHNNDSKDWTFGQTEYGYEQSSSYCGARNNA
jgi:hypothetical protein